jgi:hypothetical protein
MATSLIAILDPLNDICQKAELMPGLSNITIVFPYFHLKSLSSIKKLTTKLSILKTRALSIAHPKPLISNPLIVIEVIHNIKPLITRVKIPRVIIFNGSVSSIKRGRITALMIPRNIEPTTAAQGVSSKFGTMTAVNIMARIFNNHLSNQPCNI